MKLLVERPNHILYVKVGLFSYCFIRGSVGMLVLVIVLVSMFGRCSVRHRVAGYRWILCARFGFVSL